MLALILASAFVILPEIRVEVGTTVNTEVETLYGSLLWYGGTIYVEDERIASARGAIPPKSSRGEITIQARTPGETRLMVRYVSGMNVWTSPVATLIVECNAPGIAVAETSLRVREGQPVTLHAIGNGSAPLRVEWREGDTLLGTGATLTATLPHGVHRITAVVENACGRATAEVEVTVLRMRRRTIRH